MICEKCGSELGDAPKMMYCPQCGTVIDRSAMLEKEEKARKKRSKKISKKIGITIAVLAGILLIGGGYVVTHANCKVVVKDGVCYVRRGLFQKEGEWTGTVKIPEGVTSIGDDAFSGCRSLTNITLPEGVTSIGDHAFFGCCSLTSITLPEGVTSIGDDVFSSCGSLTSITLPKSVTSIGYRAFDGCDNLQTIKMTESQSEAFGADIPPDCQIILY